MRRMYSKPQLLEAVEQEAEVNGLKAFENIVDKDGHKRFIEGSLPVAEITGITFTYHKWSLSGSHLMLVLAGEIANGTTLSTGNWVTLTLPAWINSKIVATFSTVINMQTIYATADDYSQQSFIIRLQKSGDNDIVLRNASTTAFTAKRMFRIQFDLLIDDE